MKCKITMQIYSEIKMSQRLIRIASSLATHQRQQNSADESIGLINLRFSEPFSVNEENVVKQR